jgi:hypothetical protein
MEGATKDTGRPGRDKLSRLETENGRGRTIPQPSRPRRSVERHGRYETVGASSRNGLRPGVRASIVATKPGNAGGAKGRRKVKVE